MAQCNISNVIIDRDDCEESFSGTGTRVYVGLVSDLLVKPTINDLEEGKARFSPTCFASLNGHLAAYDIKEESGEATYETNPDGGGFNNKYEFTVAKGMDEFSHEMRALNNQKFIAFVPDGKGGYFVYYSAMGSAKIESGTGTTGKAASDEHGHTITISASPMYYPLMKWYPSNSADLDDWLEVPISGNQTTYTVTFSGTGYKVTANGIVITTGVSVPKGAKITITPDSGKKLTAVNNGSDLSVGDGTSVSFNITSNTTITVTTASAT